MPIFENKKHGLNFSGVSEEKMDKIIPKDEAKVIYCVGNGFGRIEEFENYYSPEITYRKFIDKLIEKGLLIQKF